MIPSIKDLPPPLVPSASAILTGKHLTTLEVIMAQRYAQFGQAISTKQHAAARMAGYLVVSASMGEKPRACDIGERDQVGSNFWSVFVEWDADYLQTPISQDTNPLTLVKAALHYEAGVGGEAFNGLYHPASSLPDVYRSGVCSVLLDYLFKVPLNTYCVRLAALSMQILNENSIQFEALRSHLEENESISQLEASMLMESVSVVDLSQYLGRLQ
jgi:hypothetical protein